jgi:hypothetical protein
MTRLLVILMMMFQVSSAWALAGTIQNILGSAKIHKKTGQINPAVRNDQLYEGDTIIAENASNVQIRMIDGAVIWLRANSEFKIDTYKSKKNGSDTDESNLKLLTGSMRTVTGLIGKQNPDGYKLSTPNATIGVRGTEYDAVFVSPSASGQFRAEAGTYHRVFQGATQFKAGTKEQRVDEGQAVFAGLSNPEAARKLSDIPAFLNLPPNATQSSAPNPNSESPAAITFVPLLLNVRYGNPEESAVSSTGRAGPSRVYTVKLDSGKQLMVPGQAVFGDWPLQIGRDTVDSANYSVAIKALATPGSDAAQLSFGDVQAVGRPGTASTYKLSLELSMGKWTEVSFKGPWQATSNGTSARRATSSAPVFVMLSTAR